MSNANVAPLNGAGVADDAERDVASKLGKAMGDIGIPPCPIVLQQINGEMAKEEPDLKRIDSAVCSDVGLAAGLVAFANSPYFGFRHRVRSVREALQMLGLQVASRAIACLILRNTFPPTPTLERFWDASARIARLSGWLAQERRTGVRLRADEVYTFGLFRDCGIPILMKRFAHYPEVLKEANRESERSFTSIEDALCGTNHAAVGCLLAQAWWLPDEISLAIRYHHDGPLAVTGTKATPASTTLGLIATAQLAEHLLQRHTGQSHTEEWPKVGEACLHFLNIDEERLAAIYGESVTVATAPL